jgi:tetratricopeptide (TPR) repeat protein
MTEKKPEKKLTRAEQRELDTKIEFIEGLVRRDPLYVDALQILGDHYTQRGRFTDGLQIDEKLAQLEPESPIVFYNLACSYALTQEFDRAVSALNRAIDLGYRDFTWLAKDPDLKNLREHAAYEEIKSRVRELKKDKRDP